MKLKHPKHPSAHPLVDPKTFRAWLEKQPGRKIVGETRTPEACPCQQCIADIAGLPEGAVIRVGVFDTTIILPEPTADPFMEIENPVYLQDLIMKIDEHGDRQNTGVGKASITAGTVLKLLYKVTPEVAPK